MSLDYPFDFRFTVWTVKIRASDMDHSKNCFGSIEPSLLAITVLYPPPFLFYYTKIYFPRGMNDFRRWPLRDKINFNLRIMSLALSQLSHK